MKARIFVFLFACLLACFGASAATLGQVRAEQVASLPITNGATISEQQVFAYCSRIAPGAVVSVYAQAEVTDPYGFNVGVGYVIRAWDYYVDPNGVSTFISSWNASPPVMTNVTPNTHHLVVPVAFADSVAYKANANTRCYTLVMWAVSSNGSGALQVEQGYGYFQILVH